MGLDAGIHKLCKITRLNRGTGLVLILNLKVSLSEMFRLTYKPITFGNYSVFMPNSAFGLRRNMRAKTDRNKRRSNYENNYNEDS